MERHPHALADDATHIAGGPSAPPGLARRRALAALRSAWAPAVFVLLCYATWTLAYLHNHHDIHQFIQVGRNFAHQSTRSAAINAAVGPGSGYTFEFRVGYDGQFCYFIALDPVNARYYIDRPAFRYGRILYPIAARLLAFGQPALIPYTLLLINWLAVGAGTLFLALWLQRRGRPPWLAIVYGLYSGLLIAYKLDLTEPLGYGLVALAIYLFDFGGTRRILWSGLAFAAALLTRETTVVFAGLYGIAPILAALSVNRAAASTAADASSPRVWRDRLLAAIRTGWRQSALLLGIAFAPYLLYKLFLQVWVGSPGFRADLAPQLIPFGGLLAHWSWSAQGLTVITHVIPGLVCATLGLIALRRSPFRVEVWALLANILLFVVMLPSLDYVDYQGTSRIAMGVVVAALLCVPAFDAFAGRRRWWLSFCGVLWSTVAFLIFTGRV